MLAAVAALLAGLLLVSFAAPREAPGAWASRLGGAGLCLLRALPPTAINQAAPQGGTGRR